jgi:hypothetical protein
LEVTALALQVVDRGNAPDGDGQSRRWESSGASVQLIALFAAIAIGLLTADQSVNAYHRQWWLVLPDRIELSTSPLPMECSTTELRQHARYMKESALKAPY